MALVIVRAPLTCPASHRQDRLCTVERLDLALLVDAEHQRAVRRRQIEAYDVADLVHEVRIARTSLNGLRAVRLQAEGAPDAPDRRVRKAAFPGHRAQRPMGGVRRRRAERLDNLGHLIVRERSRPSRPRLIRRRPRCAPSGSDRRHLPTVCSHADQQRCRPPGCQNRLRSAGSCGSDRRSRAPDPACHLDPTLEAIRASSAQNQDPKPSESAAALQRPKLMPRCQVL